MPIAIALSDLAVCLNEAQEQTDEERTWHRLKDMLDKVDEISDLLALIEGDLNRKLERDEKPEFPTYYDAQGREHGEY